MKRKLDNIFEIESSSTSPSFMPKNENGEIDKQYQTEISITESPSQTLSKKTLDDSLLDLEKDIFKNKEKIDELLEMAIEDYKKMMYLAYSSEPKIAGSIFEPAVELFRTVLEKKGLHIEQKLQLYKAMIMKSRVDKIKDENDVKNNNLEEITVIDRNRLLSIIKKEGK